jgi:hypothetical protein
MSSHATGSRSDFPEIPTFRFVQGPESKTEEPSKVEETEIFDSNETQHRRQLKKEDGFKMDSSVHLRIRRLRLVWPRSKLPQL